MKEFAYSLPSDFRFVFDFETRSSRGLGDEIGEKQQAGQPPEEDKEFTRQSGMYWITVILLLGVVVTVAVIDFIATRKYWMARYKEIKADHESKLQRDLAVFRQQKLNDRARGLRKSDDETPPEGLEPLE